MKPKWEKIVSRTDDVLHWSAVISIRRKKLHFGDIYWGTKNDLVLRNNEPIGSYYTNINARNPSDTNLEEYLKEENGIINNAFDIASKQIENNLKTVPSNNRDDLIKLYELFRLEMGTMLFGYVAGYFISEKIKLELGEKEWEILAPRVSYPFRKTFAAREIEEIAKAQGELNNDESRLKSIVEELADKYGFLHSEYVAESWKPGDYERAIRGKNLVVSVHEEEDLGDLNGYQKWLISKLQEAVFIFDEAKASLIRCNWALRESIKKQGVDDSIILKLSEDEFYNWVKKDVLPEVDVLEERKKYYAIYSVEGDLEYYLDKNSVIEFARSLDIVSTKSEVKDFIEGKTAFKGKVRGIVKVVYSQEDSRLVSDKNIIVAAMTTPEHIDGMMKALAYVTDEGGITSHAAIVAREFKKPCIVGTKIATQVLKDGMEVEVDADNGVVRIL